MKGITAMAGTDYDITNDINTALYNIRSRSLTNITPFTYRDGLTYLQILERIRQAVTETIDYCNGFGDDVDVIIEAVNTTVTKFITDVNAEFAKYKAATDAAEANINALETTVNNLVTEFRAKLIETAFTVTGDKISAPLMAGGTIETMTYEGTKSALATLQASLESLISAETTARNAAIAAETQARNDADSLRPTLTAADARYEPIHLRESCVIIGSSNAVTDDLWGSQLCTAMGWDYHNYAIGGGAFTSTVNSSFLAQATNAFNGLGVEAAKKVTRFIIADMLNDIRATNDISGAAPQVFDYISRNFPKAEITVMPVVLNMNKDMNGTAAIQRSVRNRIREVEIAGLPYGVKVVPGTPSWLYDDGFSITDKPNEVHLTPAGYTRIGQYMITYFKGGYTWRDTAWIPLMPYSQPMIDRSNSDFNFIRTKDACHLRGTFRLSADQSHDTVLFNVPTAGLPWNDSVRFTCVNNNRVHSSFYINELGQCATGELSTPAGDYEINVVYYLW